MVTHNAEAAHRLYTTPGKCQRIHGHSLRIQLSLVGEVDDHGLLAGIDFGTLKSEFRGFLDSYLDHSLLLNENDPFAAAVMVTPKDEYTGWDDPADLPGLRRCAGDPTTENIAQWIGEWASLTFAVPHVYSAHVHVDETPANGGDYDIAMNHVEAQRKRGDVPRLTEVLGRLA